MYRHDAPHGIASVIPVADNDTHVTTIIKQLTMNGSKRMNLIHEALARARMREIWRGEHRHRRRSARQIIISTRRAERGRY